MTAVRPGARRHRSASASERAQYDPTIEVVPDTGDVFAVFLNADRAGGFSTVHASTDHGKDVDESGARLRQGDVDGQARGDDQRVGQGRVRLLERAPGWRPLGWPVARLRKTWTQQKLTDSKLYFYAYDARVLGDGTVVFAESSLQYAGLKNVQGESGTTR